MFPIFSLLFIVFLMVIPLYKTGKTAYQYFKQLPSNNRIEREIDTLDSLLLWDGEEVTLGRKLDYAELLFIGLSPIAGFVFMHFFMDHMAEPFDQSQVPTLLSYTLIAYASYWLSRKKKWDLPSWVLPFLGYGMVLGSFISAGLALHFLAEPTLSGIAFLPLMTFPMVAPLPVFFYVLREWRDLQSFRRERVDGLPIWLKGFPIKTKLKGMVSFALFISFLALVQCLLVLFGQEWDGIFQVFWNSKDFLFSVR